MGICQAKTTQNGQEQQQAKVDNRENQNIEKRIDDDKAAARKQVKLLLLGPGESGKSTILKQMRILHDNGFSEGEILTRSSAVYSNTVQSMAMLLRGMEQLSLRLESVEREADARVVLDIVLEERDREPFNHELYASLKRLWDDIGVVEAYARRNEFQLNDSAKYFLDSIERIYSRNFVPNTQDILMTRVPTIGVSEVDFHFKGLTFRVFDVGGQKSERRKWIHCFDNVNALIFVIAISEYDQTLREDGQTNRIFDSLDLFNDVINNRYFAKTATILFLNKKDLFEEKIKRVSLKVTFADYAGGNNYDEAIEFLREKFESLNQNPTERLIYTHYTRATDTGQVEVVLDAVMDMMIEKNMEAAAVM